MGCRDVNECFRSLHQVPVVESMKFRAKPENRTGQGAVDRMKFRWPNRVRFASTNSRWFLRGVSPMIWRRILLRSDQTIDTGWLPQSSSRLPRVAPSRADLGPNYTIQTFACGECAHSIRFPIAARRPTTWGASSIGSAIQVRRAGASRPPRRCCLIHVEPYRPVRILRLKREHSMFSSTRGDHTINALSDHPTSRVRWYPTPPQIDRPAWRRFSRGKVGCVRCGPGGIGGERRQVKRLLMR